jgi:hypothetical protein
MKLLPRQAPDSRATEASPARPAACFHPSTEIANSSRVSRTPAERHESAPPPVYGTAPENVLAKRDCVLAGAGGSPAATQHLRSRSSDLRRVRRRLHRCATGSRSVPARQSAGRPLFETGDASTSGVHPRTAPNRFYNTIRDREFGSENTCIALPPWTATGRGRRPARLRDRRR